MYLPWRLSGQIKIFLFLEMLKFSKTNFLQIFFNKNIYLIVQTWCAEAAPVLLRYDIFLNTTFLLWFFFFFFGT
jgi:hypothetical protein